MEFLSVFGKRVLMITCLLISTATITGQTVLIDPEGDGGFENGATFEENGWVVENGAESPWTLGYDYEGYPPLSNRKAYASEDGGQTAFIQSSGGATNYFYRDVYVPEGEEFITLEFDWYNETTNYNTHFAVLAGDTSYTPQAFENYYECCQAPAGAFFLTAGINLQPEYYMGVQHAKVQVPMELAGTTMRLIFLVSKWLVQFSPGTATSMIDNISLVSNPMMPLCGEYTIDNNTGNTIYTGGVNFNSFTDAIYHLNTNGKCGSVFFNVTAGQEFPESPPDIRVSGTIDAPIVFQKNGAGPNPVISPSGTGLEDDYLSEIVQGIPFPHEKDRCITLRGVSFLTWDGIDVIAENGLMENGFLLIDSDDETGSANNIIRNCTVKLNKMNVYGSTGILVFQYGGDSPLGLVEKNTIENVHIINSRIGITLWEANAGNVEFQPDSNRVVNCTIGAPISEVPDGDILGIGIYVRGQKNCILEGNVIQNIAGPTDNFGIRTYQTIGTLEVSGNTVRHVRNSSGSQPTDTDGQYGIYIDHEGTSLGDADIFIFNNMISDISSNYSLGSDPLMVQALRLGGNEFYGDLNFHVINNSIALSNSSPHYRSACISGYWPEYLIGNSIASFSTLEANSTGQYLVVGAHVSDFNNFFHANPNGRYVGATTSLAEWVDNSENDLNSISVNPQYQNFLSDLHTASPDLVGAGNLDDIDYITTDIDGVLRPTPPSIGADEPIPSACLPPSGVSVTMLSGNDAFISWEPTDAESYNWELRAGVFPPGSDTTNLIASGNSLEPELTIENIPYNSNPTFFVESVCIGDVSSVWVNELVQVPVACQLAPFVETFDDWTADQSDINGIQNSCWTSSGTWRVRHSSSNEIPEPGAWLGSTGLDLSSTDASTGTGSYLWYSPNGSLPMDDGENAHNNSLISGEIDLIDMENRMVSMSVAFYNNGLYPGGDGYNELKLYALNGAEWLEIGVFDDASHPEWFRWNVVIPEIIPDVTRFKLIVWSVSGEDPGFHPLMIDDFAVHDGNVQGIIYADMNCNDEFDGTDILLPGQIVRINEGTPVAYSDANGAYTTYLDSIYIDSIYLHSLPGWTINNYGINDSLPSDLSELDFRLCPTGDVADLGVSVSPVGPPPRPGFNLNYTICRSNYGTIPSQTELVFGFSQMPEVGVIDAAGGSIGDSTIVWQADEIGIFETECIQIELQVAPGTEVGIVYTPEVFISTVPDTLIDVNMDNNTHSFSEIVVAAYDPNDKIVDQPIVNHTEIDPDEGVELEYVIRFQNTGNFYATNVSVIDELPDLLDINTIEMIQASHDFELVFHNDHKVEWFFEDIMLPDSTTDEPGSHGFIHFRINTVSEMQLEDVIQNNANIYFDYKEAVVTDYAETSFFDCSEESLSIIGPDSVCTNSFFELETNREDFYELEWTISEENFQGLGIEWIFADQGVQTVILEAFHPVCTLGTSTEILVEPYPAMDVYTGTYLFCESFGVIDRNCNGVTSWYLDDTYLGTADSMMINEAGLLNIVCSNDCGWVQSYNFVVVHNTPEVSLNFAEGVLSASPPGDEYSWFFNDSLIIDAPNEPELIPYETGNYSVTVVFETGCSNSSSSQFVPVSLHENTKSKIYLYPNPTKDVVTLRLPEGEWYIQLMDTRGKVFRTIQSANRRQLELNLSELAGGVYFVMVKSSSTYVVKKLVVK